jgi:hypothetical protein
VTSIKTTAQDVRTIGAWAPFRDAFAIARRRRSRRPMTTNRLVHAVLLATGTLAVAVAHAAEPSIGAAPLVTPFSVGTPGPALPAGWQPVAITDRKRPTEYDLVSNQGVVVLHARADAAASVVAHRVAFDLRAAPVVEWRWRIANLIEGADNRVAAQEDSPVRLIFEFDGDKSKLSFGDRAIFMASRAASGNELPYATLMYVWSNTLPIGAVVPNPHTRRVQMVVAASGAADVGRWLTLRRNLLEDYVRAFGEPPGRLTAVGVLTDTDNTGKQAEAWYGDIRFGPGER